MFIQSMTYSFEKGKEHRLYEHYTAKMQYKVSLLNDELLSLTISTYTYTGGAHGASTLEGYTFKLATGERMLYRDLFPFDNESRQALNEKIEQQIRDRNIIIFKPYQGVSDNPNYYLKEGNRLVIIFGQYEIAPYAAGILQFEIPQNTRGSTTY